MSVRITGLQEVATLQNGDYIAIDNESNGTHKFDAMKMGANMASNIAPAYSTAATYAIGDFCMHDGILYKCTTAINTPESWTASHWTQTSAGVALAQKVDKVSGKGLSQNDFTDALKTKLDGIASGAEVNVQADWAQTNTSADDYIKNKPVDATASVGGLMSASDKAKLNGIAAGAEVNVQADWTETNTSSDAYIKNKPTNATSSTAGLMSAADKAKLDGIASGAEVNVQADWSQTNTSADDYIKNKPVDATSSVGGLMSATDKAKLDSIEQGAEVNVQADWNQTNTSADDYIKNKPTNATTSTAGLMSASDKTKLNGIETGAQVNVIDGVKVDGTLLTVDGNKDVDIIGKANQASLAPQYLSDTGNYVRGNYVIYQNNLYKCLQDTSGVWDATKWEQVDICTDLEEKANIDGLYEEMTVGGAEQLISDTFNIESVPYNFRTSGGSLDIGDRETDKLIGGTIAWNQLVQNGNFTETSGWAAIYGSISTSNNECIYTITNQDSTFVTNRIQRTVNIVSGHKYLVLCGLYPTKSGTTRIRIQNDSYKDYSQVTVNSWNDLYAILNTSSGGSLYIQLSHGGSSYAVNDSYKWRNVRITDLTQMFGTTIADYIYNLEQNTAGAGVAFFKKLFPAPYYAYNAGQLMSVNAGSHVMNGFNQWDEVWELGTIKWETGENEASSAYIRSKNYIPALPNTVYHITVGNGVNCNVFYYDSNKNCLGKNYIAGNGNGNFTTKDGTAYIRFSPYNTYGTTYNNDICINIAWDGERNGEYEPYVSHTYELDDTLELRGLPKLDENNQLYYDGDVYESDGTVTRNWAEVDLGSLTWQKYSDKENVFVTVGISSGKKVGNFNLICSKYSVSSVASITNMPDKVIKGHLTTGNIYIEDSAFATDWTNNTPSNVKTAMDGVKLVYELATPTTESATPYTNPQIVNDWGTETYTDYSYDAQTRDVQIPVGHETRYMANLKAKLEMAPESPNGDGDYIVRQTSGENTYVAIGSSPTIQHKAEIDGTYDDMNVGGAKQLLSNVFEEDQVPYTFRTSGGSIDIGDREYDTVVGGTIAWNQLCKTDVQWNSSDNGIGTLIGNTYKVTAIGYSKAYSFADPTGIRMIDSHVYFVYYKISELGGNVVKAGIKANSDPSVSTNHLLGGVGELSYLVKKSSSGMLLFQAGFYCGENNVTQDDYAVFSKYEIIDITQMFGSVIADYIYSLEQATAGAGVAWFRKLFPKPYYEYNAGELLSVEGVSSHDMTGFNQLDDTEVMTNAGFVQQQDGSWYVQYASVPYLKKVWENKLGYGGRICVSYEYKYSTTNVGVILVIKYTDGSATSCSYQGTTSYMKSVTVSTSDKVVDNIYFTYANNGSGSYFKNLCINFSWDGERDGEYEPYRTWSYPLDDTLELRGIPKLDASNNLYYDGDTYESDGTVTRKYGVYVFDGTEEWVRITSWANPAFRWYSDGFRNTLPNAKRGGMLFITDTKYTVVPAQYSWEGIALLGDNIIGTITGDAGILIRDDSITNESTFKQSLIGKKMVYELTTPTTETADSFQSPQIVDDWGTEEYVTTSIVPVGHDTKYTANLRAKIEMAPDSPSGDGDYIVRQADGTNSYVPLVIPNELPTMPTTDGTYRLQVVVASGTPTLSWVSAT